ncbi:MAG: hypothetical protein K2X62_03230 [Beijerinckiaceae bacterium]|nr:hypothetical protein [Beijerinckiaceae bacterium]MDO9443374.1 hypothetical protein [Beijerinckiaceae bacterium]
MAKEPRKTKPEPPRDIVSEPRTDFDSLPPRIAALRSKILEATATRDLEKLRSPVEWNEVPPIFQRGLKKGPGFDPLAVLKTRSFDREGREMLAILQAVLEAPFVTVKRGPFESFVWPAFAVSPPKDPDEATRLHMLRCVRFEDLGAVNSKGGLLLHRVSIGADATWHVFTPDE